MIRNGGHRATRGLPQRARDSADQARGQPIRKARRPVFECHTNAAFASSDTESALDRRRKCPQNGRQRKKRRKPCEPRRELLAATATTALLAREAHAQSFPFTPNQRYPDPAIQILDPSFAKYRIYSSTVEQIATGMRWAEGPAYFPEGGYLLFSDIPNNRIMKFDEKTGQTSVFRSPSNYANGNTRDRQGRLVTCEHSVTRRITRTEKDGKITVLADKFEGKRLNAPNDIVVKSDDSIWFTDPLFGINGEWEGKKEKPEQATTNVYRIAKDGKLTAVITDHRQSKRPCVLAGRKEALRRQVEGHAESQHLGL